jgi:2-polyprenyl-3-methyl-5-hydroxy-6-metoxy-1,4-benzoquinol methylase
MKEEDEILKSWDINATEWSQVMEQEGIASRKFTNPAIVEAITNYEPLKILDLGCGEGWLTRALSHEKNKVIGVDATETLLETARKKGTQKYYRLAYKDIVKGANIPEAPFDAVVLNFCLYQKNEVPDLLIALQRSLSDPGLIFIQTLHPSYLLMNELPYEDQWIGDSWKGLNGNFIQPHSWYARTLENWINTFRDCRYELIKVKEVINNNKVPVSIIFILKTQKNAGI